MFASDTHLGEHDTATADWFLQSLQREAAAPGQAASHVLLLGDVFEAWIGDDQDDPIVTKAMQVFRDLAIRCRLFVMRGNRDFLFEAPGQTTGASFTARSGATLLDDPCVIDLFGRRTLLTHGDAWCIDDHDYQEFRRTTREATWQRAFVAQPLSARQAIARQMRQRSELEKRDKAAYLMDVNHGEVERTAQRFDVTSIVHGHTHRPALHQDTPVDRWVLPDWDAAATRGGFLRVDREGWQRVGW